MRTHLNRGFSPREEAKYMTYDTAYIMWTKVQGKRIRETHWRPNHFVLLMPLHKGLPEASISSGPTSPSPKATDHHDLMDLSDTNIYDMDSCSSLATDSTCTIKSPDVDDELFAVQEVCREDVCMPVVGSHNVAGQVIGHLDIRGQDVVIDQEKYTQDVDSLVS